jgi:Family of unknown function (DUF6228)
MTREFSIRSSRDGVTLTLSNFVIEDPSEVSYSFLVEVKNYEIRAEARSSSYMAPNFGDFFSSLAKDWKGWDGERSWATLEGEFELAATSDRLGHIQLRFFLRPAYTGLHWELRGALELEAGQLDSIAQEAREVWKNC